MKIRLNKFLAEAGVASRRHADDLILAGKVKINGKAINTPGIQVDPDFDKVEVGGNLVKPLAQLVYYALNKPKGVISTASDEIGRQNVTELVPAIPRVYPVGRLDAETEGLIILTNDGELTQKLTHPSFEHEKQYLVKVKSSKQNSQNAEAIKNNFERGLLIDGKLMRADKVEINVMPNANYLLLDIILHTGFNRQIRKMCAKIGLEILKLERVRINKLNLSDLNIESGKYKQITKEQIV